MLYKNISTKPSRSCATSLRYNIKMLSCVRRTELKYALNLGHLRLTLGYGTWLPLSSHRCIPQSKCGHCLKIENKYKENFARSTYVSWLSSKWNLQFYCFWLHVVHITKDEKRSVFFRRKSFFKIKSPGTLRPRLPSAGN